MNLALRFAALILTALPLAPPAALQAADGRDASAGNLVLVEQGVRRAPIIVFEDAPPRTRQAADELASYIQKTSGARPEVVEGEPQPLPERGIRVGFQPALKTLFPNVDFGLKHPEEILIAASENHLVIAGRDRWDKEHMEGKGRLAGIPACPSDALRNTPALTSRGHSGVCDSSPQSGDRITS